ncbi:putative RING-H2 finger protein ATL12 [Ziziphus jujuba]|uniref:RING-H2 finger protein ATL12 n=1 Tax=Ziziphus jujuba TaxID=326968 RepID=A0A6P3ZUK1_ZIZJJ|nr:putative RING-H2 finger protein ATL12 [Ziziphus jujuba]
MIFILLLFQFAKPQNEPDADSVLFPHPIHTNSNQIHPSLAIVIGVLFIMFFITLSLVAYAKFCITNPLHFNFHHHDFHGLIRPRSRQSGLDRTVIESLPFFRFSSLKGSKKGLECAICISKFQETEILRLLPNCNHAFHIDCIDQWLENHSTCPLCRYKIDAGDLKNIIYSNSSRSLARKVPSNLTEDLNLELFIQREEAHDNDQHHGLSSRFIKAGVGSFRKSMDMKLLHKFKHKILISDAVVRNRWSDVNSSDFLSLNSEMLGVMSSQRFSLTESNSKIDGSDSYPTLSCFPSTSSICCEQSTSTGQLLINTNEKRSMSEITNLSRFTEFNMNNYNKRSKGSGSDANSSKEERMKRIWLQIAGGTVRWFASSEELKYRQQPLNV